MYFNIRCYLCLRLQTISFPQIYNGNSVCIFRLYHMWYTACPSNPIWFDHSYNVLKLGTVYKYKCGQNFPHLTAITYSITAWLVTFLFYRWHLWWPVLVSLRAVCEDRPTLYKSLCYWVSEDYCISSICTGWSDILYPTILLTLTDFIPNYFCDVLVHVMTFFCNNIQTFSCFML